MRQRRLFSGNLPAFSLETELSVILEFERICRIHTPNKITLTLRKTVSFYLLFNSRPHLLNRLL